MAKQKETTKKKVVKKVKKKAVKKKAIKKRNVKSPATALKKAMLLEKLERTLGIVSRACEVADIPRSNFYKWYHADIDFKKKVDDIENIALDFVETQHYKSIEAGNPANIIFHLKTKGKHRGYRENIDITHSQSESMGEIRKNIKQYLGIKNDAPENKK